MTQSPASQSPAPTPPAGPQRTGSQPALPIPLLPPEGSGLGTPSLQPGQPGSPIFTLPRPSGLSPEATRRGVVSGPILPNSYDVSADAAGPAGASDPAYGAYQRGYYTTAAHEAQARAQRDPKDAAAMTLLGELYRQGLGVGQDSAKAAEWYAKAAALGDANAAFALAMQRLQGRGVAKDEASGLKLLQQAAAAAQPEASYNLALVKLAEPGDAGATEAVRLLRIAADGEIADAQYMLAQLYKAGTGVPQSDADAAKLMARAAENRLLAAQVEYAIMLFNGKGVGKDEAAGARLFEQAAERGNAIAQNRLARLLVSGRGIHRDPTTAAGWHMLAAGQGLTDTWLDDALKGLTPQEVKQAEAFAQRRREETSVQTP